MLHVIDCLRRGGAQSMLGALLHELAGDDSGVVSYVRAGSVGGPPDPDLLSSVGADSADLGFLLSDHVYDLRFPVGIARAIRRHRIDVVHAHLITASVGSRGAAALLRRPHISSLHTMPGSTLTDTRAWLAADALTARLSTRFVAPSHEVAEASAHHYRIGAERFRVIPNSPTVAPAPSSARPALRRELLDAGPNDKVVLCVARLVPGKGVDVLIDAAEQLGRRVGALRVVVAGAGEEHDRLAAVVSARGQDGRVTLLGHRTDIGRLFACADAFCLPSLHEAAPISLLDAMSAGCPCVASAVGGIPEMLEDGACGVLVAPGDASALADALERVLADGALAGRLAAAARAAIDERYAIGVVARRYVELYRELAGAR